MGSSSLILQLQHPPRRVVVVAYYYPTLGLQFSPPIVNVTWAGWDMVSNVDNKNSYKCVNADILVTNFN